MKQSLNNLLRSKIFLSCLFLLVSVSSAGAVKIPAGTKIGLVDKYQALKQSTYVKNIYDDMAKSKARVQRMIATADEEIAELEKEGKDKKAILTKKQEIQKILDKEVMGFQKQQASLATNLEKKIDTIMVKLAADKGYKVILDKAFVIEGGDDLTAEFIKRLESSK